LAVRPPVIRAGDPSCAVVGIGASAGGLDAFKKFFSAMPAGSGMAFVLIPHLDPTHESLMVELMARQTSMPVREARDGMPVVPDHVYVIPPNADLTIEHRVLRVTPPPPRRGSHTAIDVFLRSLAADEQERAVGIILSGTGNHGTLGLKDIKAAGGLAIAQSPESAEHDQMPKNAIASGVIDYILPPDQMPQALMRHLTQLAAPAPDLAPEALDQILLLLRTEMKRDFRGYRRGMLLRRVKRRMGLSRVDQVAGYVDYLRAHAEEVQALGKDLSIGVTAFFREPQAFQVIERVVIPDLTKGGRAGDDERPVRVWVPGCATGEEAYSIGMLFLEAFAAAKEPVRLQIFATDIDEDALDVARAGLYPDSIAADVPVERLRRFFVKAGDHQYQVNKALREVITFAPQNLIGDAPFSRLDLVACRNVLIYLEPDVQMKVIALFHFALVDGGYLVLGPAESIGQATDRFEPVSKTWRVYRRSGAGGGVEIPILAVDAPHAPAAPRGEQTRRSVAIAERLHRALLADFAPAAVLINPRHEILSLQGPVVEYLEFPAGEPTRDLLSMARSGLRTAIREACESALRARGAAINVEARVKREGRYVPCVVTARPVAGENGAPGLLLVTFQDRPARGAAAPPTRRRPGSARGAASIVGQLEHELTATREDLQGTIDELQAANEELKASHEEVMSMNEELQSTNEEMETSKEELQSLNEELSTVNSQLQDKVNELDRANSDMLNLLASSEIATVFLDADLAIKRFTLSTTKVLNLLPTDLGRPFRDIAPRVTDVTLLDDCRHVIEKLTPIEAIVRVDHAQAYLRRVLPYRTADHRIEGVVITWVDITARLASEAESRHLSVVLRDSNDSVVLLDLAGRIIGWNRGAERLSGYTEAEALTMRAADLIPAGQPDPAADLLRQIIRGDMASGSVEVKRTAKDGQPRDLWLTLTLLRDATGQPDAVVATGRDVTELKEGVAARQAAQLYQQMVEHLPAGAVLRNGDHITMNRAAEEMTGYLRSDLITVGAWCAALHGPQAAEQRTRYDAAPLSVGVPQPISLAIVRKDGATRHLQLTISRLDDRHQMWMMLDMTEHDQAERALRHSEDYLRSIVTTVPDGIITIDEHAVIETFNPAAERMFGYTATEIIGQKIGRLLSLPQPDEYERQIERYLSAGEARLIDSRREMLGVRKDGTTFPVALALTEVDHVRRFTGIMHDLSNRQRLQWRLAESQADERRHMARELHDDIGGHMTGIGLIAQGLLGELVKTDSPLAARTRELVESIHVAHQRLRSVIRGLMPVEAMPDGLMAALTHLAGQCEAASRVSCHFECEPPVSVDDPAMALHLFRIAQEAVNNAVRHAQPVHIGISLAAMPQRIEVVVTDDGRGFSDIKADHSGTGLESMRQRAHLLGGDISLRPREGGGTVLTCWVPRRSGLADARPDGSHRGR
jgi:two-component system CheB/CheR fusion protein